MISTPYSCSCHDFTRHELVFQGNVPHLQNTNFEMLDLYSFNFYNGVRESLKLENVQIIDAKQASH